MYEKNMTATYVYNDEMYNYNYAKNIKPLQAISLIKNVTDVVIDMSDAFIYIATLKDIIFDYCLIDVFTDIDISFLEDDLDKIYDFVINTDIAETIKSNAENSIIQNLEKDINQSIQLKTGIKVNSIEDTMVNVIKEMTDNINIADFNTNKISDLINSVKAMNDNSELFTPDKIIEAFANTEKYRKK